MPIDRPVLVDSSGKVLLDASGQLADPACCCGGAVESGFACCISPGDCHLRDTQELCEADGGTWSGTYFDPPTPVATCQELCELQLCCADTADLNTFTTLSATITLSVTSDPVAPDTCVSFEYSTSMSHTWSRENHSPATPDSDHFQLWLHDCHIAALRTESGGGDSGATFFFPGLDVSGDACDIGGIATVGGWVTIDFDSGFVAAFTQFTFGCDGECGYDEGALLIGSESFEILGCDEDGHATRALDNLPGTYFFSNTGSGGTNPDRTFTVSATVVIS